MNRTTPRWLLAFVLLLALFAGGTMTLVMPSSVAMSGMSDQSCTACGEETAPASCDVVCIVQPGLEPLTLHLDRPSSQARWALSSETGATHVIAPDRTPPRA